MKTDRPWRTAALLTAGLLAGSLIGPTVVNAVSSAVKIEDRDSTTRADVDSNHRLHVDSEAGVANLGGTNFLDTYGLAFTIPNGELVLVSGNSGCNSSKSGAGVITGVNVNLGEAASQNLTVDVTNASGSKLIWEATISQGSIGSTASFIFENGIYSPDGFKVVMSNAPATAKCQVYGEGFGVTGRPSLRNFGNHS